MAIKLTQGFNITSANPVDMRVLLSKADMLTINPNIMPEKYIAICKEDGKLYIYDKNAEASEETGKFVPYEDKIDLPAAIAKSMSSSAGKEAIESAISQTLPGAISDAMQTEGEAEKIAQALFSSDHFEVTVDKKIDLAISIIESIDGN